MVNQNLVVLSYQIIKLYKEINYFNIVLTFYGNHHKEVQNDLEVLKIICKKLKKIDDYNQYNTHLVKSYASRTAYLCEMFGTIDNELVEFSFSMEAIKSILNISYNLDL